MYIEGGCLLYKGYSGCFCCVKQYRLSKVHRVEVIEDETMKYQPKLAIKLSPGLRIGVVPDITILVSTTDAVQFGGQLKTASDLV